MRLIASAMIVSALITGPALAQQGEKTRDEAVAAAEKKFKRMDADGNGSVTSAEMLSFQQAMEAKKAERGETAKTVDPAKVEKNFKKMDTNGDGSLSLDEVKEDAGRKFDAKAAKSES